MESQVNISCNDEYCTKEMDSGESGAGELQCGTASPASPTASESSKIEDQFQLTAATVPQQW